MSASKNDSPNSSYMDWNDSDPEPEPDDPDYEESSDSEGHSGMDAARCRSNLKPDSDGKCSSNGTRSKATLSRSECSSSPDCKKPCPTQTPPGMASAPVEQLHSYSNISSSVSSYKSTSSSPSSVPSSSIIDTNPTTSSKQAPSNAFIKCSDLVDIDPDEDDFEYQVLTPEMVVQHMIEIIREVNAVLSLPHTVTRMLLTHFKWDKERLLERFFDGDPESVFEEAHLIYPLKYTDSDCSTELTASKQSARTSQMSTTSSSRTCASQSSSARRGPTTRSMVNSTQPNAPNLGANRGAVECSICACAVLPECLTGVGCEHVFCTRCWGEYLRQKIVQECSSNSISCPAFRCEIYVDDEFVMRLIGSRDELVCRRYQHLITNSFVACNRLLRWCSKPDCGNAIRVRHVDRRPVRCSCGQIMCFQCGNAWHDPVQCEYLRRWIKKCDDDSETSNWIAANTKECPKCHVTIEKDGGCNHMICKNINCKYEFCWVCMDAWEPHGSSWYNCTRYNEEGSKHARDQQDRSRSALQRYLFYYNRYMNHMQSLRFEHKLYVSVHEKMEAMQTVANMSWIEVQFLQRAVDVLCQCRRTLMYTYVFAFYLRRNNQSLIFEENQKDLAFATEQLSEYLERDSVDTLTHLMPGARSEMPESLVSLTTPFSVSYSSSLPPNNTSSRHNLAQQQQHHNRGRTVSSSASAIASNTSILAPSAAEALAASAAIQSHANMLEAIQRVKQLVQDKTRYCDHRRRLLLQHVHDGYDKDLWEYTETCSS